MILGRPLTAEESLISRNNYEHYNFLNGASYMCLGEFVLTLYATHLDAPNWILNILGAMMYCGYILLPLGIRRTALRGAAISQADFWVRRNIAALLTASAVLFSSIAPWLSWVILLVGAFLFYGYRGAGVVLSTPLVGDFSAPEDVPINISRSSERFYTSGCIAIASIILLTYFVPGRATIVGIILFGACLGVFASTFLRNVHETGALQTAARAPLLPGLRKAFHNSDLRRLALGWFGLNLGRVFLYAISIAALKRGCGFSEYQVLICAILQFMGSGIVARFAGHASRYFGPRRVLAVAFSLNLLIVLAWLVMPLGTPWLIWALALSLFFILGGLNTAGENAASSYFLMVCPNKEDQVSGSVSLNLTTGVFAGVTGSILGSILIHKTELWAPHLGPYFADDLGLFRLYFALVLPLLVLCFIAILRMRTVIYSFRERHGEEAVHHAIAIGSHRKH